MEGYQIALLVIGIIVSVYLIFVLIDFVFFVSFKINLKKHTHAIAVFLQAKYDNIHKLLELVNKYAIPVNTEYYFDLMTSSITGKALVTGGQPFSGSKPYEMRGGAFLTPDYRISKAGVISGRATTSYEKRDNIVTIYAKDARGKEIARQFTIDKVVGSLKYNGPALFLKEAYVGQYTAPGTDYYLEMHYSDLEGGYKNYRVTQESLDAAQEMLSKIGMKITETAGDTTGGFIIDAISSAGYPSAATPQGFKFELIVKDYTGPNRTGDSSGGLVIPVQVNKVYGNLKFSDSSTTKAIQVDEIYEAGDEIKVYLFPDATGGKSAYSVDLISGDLGDFELYGGEGTEQTPTFPYIKGKVKKTTADLVWVFKMVDEFGQSITSTVTLKPIPEAMKLQPKFNMANVVLTKDVSILPRTGANAPQIVQGLDGRTPYKYGIEDHNTMSLNTVIPGLTLDEDTGVLYGTPTREDYGRDDYNNLFTLTGGTGRKGYHTI